MERTESLLDRYTADDLQQRYGGAAVSVMAGSSPSAFGNEIKARYLGTPLWKQALMLALLFLLAEILLLRFLK
jgi:preprotein translocase subunit SecG